jgi:hypothetical protein
VRPTIPCTTAARKASRARPSSTTGTGRRWSGGRESFRRERCRGPDQGGAAAGAVYQHCPACHGAHRPRSPLARVGRVGAIVAQDPDHAARHGHVDRPYFAGRSRSLSQVGLAQGLAVHGDRAAGRAARDVVARQPDNPPQRHLGSATGWPDEDQVAADDASSAGLENDEIPRVDRGRHRLGDDVHAPGRQVDPDEQAHDGRAQHPEGHPVDDQPRPTAPPRCGP